MKDAKTVMAALKGVAYVVAVGSVDGVCTAAAVLRLAGAQARVMFTQAFQVNMLKPEIWGEPGNVAFVDLAVNTRDDSMTADFAQRVRAAGHEIVAIIDEHDARAWEAVMAVAGLNPATLAIAPITGKGTDCNSSGAILARALSEEADGHVRALCAAADAGDRMAFSENAIADLVNRATKSAIQDNRRREHLAKRLAETAESDAEINAWCAEYAVILRNHRDLVDNRLDYGDGILRVYATGRKVDVTTLMGDLYAAGAAVAVVQGEFFNPASKKVEEVVSFGLASAAPKINLVAIANAAGINAGGMPAKISVALKDESATTAAIREALRAAR